MVQLEPRLRTLTHSRHTPFNSIMVQLEHRSGFPEWLQKYAFQFHYGSIRTGL